MKHRLPRKVKKKAKKDLNLIACKLAEVYIHTQYIICVINGFIKLVEFIKDSLNPQLFRATITSPDRLIEYNP